jgi:hypothetical protein
MECRTICWIGLIVQDNHLEWGTSLQDTPHKGPKGVDDADSANSIPPVVIATEKGDFRRWKLGDWKHEMDKERDCKCKTLG